MGKNEEVYEEIFGKIPTGRGERANRWVRMRRGRRKFLGKYRLEGGKGRIGG